MANGGIIPFGGWIQDESTLRLQAESIKMSAMAIGMSLGLTDRKLAIFVSRAYSVQRGLQTEAAYEALVELAYSIKVGD